MCLKFLWFKSMIEILEVFFVDDFVDVECLCYENLNGVVLILLVSLERYGLVFFLIVDLDCVL